MAALVALAALAAASPAVACPSMQFIGVRGSGEHSGFGHTVGSVLSSVNAHESGVGNETVNYWAVDANPWEPKYFANYMSSVKQGITNLGDAVAAFRDSCSDTPIVLAGYSQGAEVIDHWLSSGASLSNIVGVALFGDPRFSPGNGTTIDQGTYNRRLSGVSSHSYFPHKGIFGGVEHYPPNRAPWLRSYCANHDQICNTSSLTALAGCGIGSSCAHYHYADATFDGGTYTQDGASFLLSRVRAARSGSLGSRSPGTSTSTGSDIETGTDTSSAGGQGASPAATYPETVGGVTHTWTNYTNAGGVEGPSIQTGQTVQVACRVAGFAVADGDTWWYQIASSPWNGAYYASADAFYNNGETAGSLLNTPYVDPAVPNC